MGTSFTRMRFVAVFNSRNTLQRKIFHPVSIQKFTLTKKISPQLISLEVQDRKSSWSLGWSIFRITYYRWAKFGRLGLPGYLFEFNVLMPHLVFARLALVMFPCTLCFAGYLQQLAKAWLFGWAWGQQNLTQLCLVPGSRGLAKEASRHCHSLRGCTFWRYPEQFSTNDMDYGY